MHCTLENTAALAFLSINGGTYVWTGTATIVFGRIAGGRVLQGVNAGPFTTLSQTAGYVEYNSTTTLSSAHILGGVLDLSKDGRNKTIDTLAVFPGAQFLPNANTTISTTNTQGSILPIVNIVP